MTFVKEFIIGALRDFELTDKESEVYIYLTKRPRNRDEKFGN